MAEAARVTPIKPAALVIETGVPIPGNRYYGRGSPMRDAMRELQSAPLMASIFFPDAKITAVQQAAWRVGGKGWTAHRRVDGGVRVWKIAEPTLIRA